MHRQSFVMLVVGLLLIYCPHANGSGQTVDTQAEAIPNRIDADMIMMEKWYRFDNHNFKHYLEMTNPRVVQWVRPSIRDIVPEPSPLLEPIAYMTGKWTMELKSSKGERKSTRNKIIGWSGKNHLFVTIIEKKADGTRGSSGLVIYFWDPELKTIKGHAYLPGNAREERTLLTSDEEGQIWDSRIIFPNGTQGRYKCKITHDVNTHTMVWSKVSGEGSASIGPFVYKRVNPRTSATK